MVNVRALMARASVVAAVSVGAWLIAAWGIGGNSLSIYGAPAGRELSAIAIDATWLAAPVLLGAVPAWLFSYLAVERGLGPQHGRLTRWFVAAWFINLAALFGFCLLLMWHAGAPAEGPQVDLPVYIFGMWCTALTAYVPVLIGIRARRHDRESVSSLDTGGSDGDA